MKNDLFLFLSFLFLTVNITTAQVNSNLQTPMSINDDGSAPDNSAILDIKSSTKGILIPRLTKAEFDALMNPATGLMIYFIDDQAFLFFDGTDWKQIKDDADANIGNELITSANLLPNYFLELTEGGQVTNIDLSALVGDSTPPILEDTDGNTKIQVEESPNEDIIRFDLAGEEEITISQNLHGKAVIDIPGSNGDIHIGNNAGTLNLNDSFFGSPNTFIGENAGAVNTIGFSNTFIGSSAGKDNTTGDLNTFIGSRAGEANTTGVNNVFLGGAAGINHMTGSENTFVGRNSGSHNNDGDDNTFLGFQAGSLNNGDDNTFVGSWAGNRNGNIGNRNTFIGKDAGTNNTTGNDNTYIGNKAGSGSGAGGSNNVFIGCYSGFYETNSDRLHIDNTITSNSLIYGEFDNNMIRINGTLQVGNEELSDLGNDNLGVDADIIPKDGIMYDLGNNVANEHWDDIVGDDFINFSDANSKRNVQALNYGLATIVQLNPITYQYLHEPDFAKHSLGLIAQEVLEIIPEVVKTHEIDIDEHGELQETPVEFLGINYVELIPVLIKGIQEQQVLIEQLQVQNQAFQKELDALKKG